MDLEILLDVEDVDPKDLPEIEKRFFDWYKTGAEARYNKHSYQYLSTLDKPYRYQVDVGQADAIKALQTLHGKLYRFGVKVFVHFF